MGNVDVAAEWRTAPFRSAGRPRVLGWARFTVGAAGVVTLDADFSDPGITLGNFTSGAAALEFPDCPKAMIIPTIRPAALANDQVIYVTAQSDTAGTATITVGDDGSAEDPADGAVIYVAVICETRG